MMEIEDTGTFSEGTIGIDFGERRKQLSFAVEGMIGKGTLVRSKLGGMEMDVHEIRVIDGRTVLFCIPLYPPVRQKMPFGAPFFIEEIEKVAEPSREEIDTLRKASARLKKLTHYFDLMNPVKYGNDDASE